MTFQSPNTVRGQPYYGALAIGGIVLFVFATLVLLPLAFHPVYAMGFRDQAATTAPNGSLSNQTLMLSVGAAQGVSRRGTGWGHTGVMQLVINRAKCRTKTDKRRWIRLVPFCRNLL